MIVVLQLKKVWFRCSFLHFFCPLGKPMIPYLLRCQGLAIDDYGFTLGAPWIWGTLDFRTIRVVSSDREQNDDAPLTDSKINCQS